MSWKKILVATDFSRSSDAALEAAVMLARGVGGQVTVLHVCEPLPFSRPGLSMYVPSPELMADKVQSAKQRLEDIRARYARAGVAIDIACVEGGAASAEIVAYGEAHAFDVIVMGSHGRSGLAAVLLGSVAAHVVRTAHRPVLTVHANDVPVEQATADPR